MSHTPVIEKSDDQKHLMGKIRRKKRKNKIT